MAAKKKTAAAGIPAIKGFDRDWKCLDHQYQLGGTYTVEGEADLCRHGFHACPDHPLDVFGFYAPATSRYADVRLMGSIKKGDDKACSTEIRVEVEISLSDIIERAVRYVFDRAKLVKGSTTKAVRGAASATGDQGAASATGNWGAASATGLRGAASATGDWGAASATGLRGAASATGDQGAASATGYCGAASATGLRGAASATGDQGAASATGNWGAASATGDQGAASATGYCGAASATGDQGAASATGNWGAASATGDQGAAMACGYEGKASGAEGNAIFLVERNDDYEIIAVWAGIAGRDGIKPDTFYMLKDGKPEEQS